VRRGHHHRGRFQPLELSAFLEEKDVDLFIGGVKERPIAYKLGVGFCDHNHERKIPLAGFIGMVNFARECTAASPARCETHSAGRQEGTRVTHATEPLAATRNACKLCAPLGACLALRGVAGAAPFLHGSQGCATYIRRYLISHFASPWISPFPASVKPPRSLAAARICATVEQCRPAIPAGADRHRDHVPAGDYRRGRGDVAARF